MKTNIGSSIDIMLCERDLVRIIVKNQKNKKKNGKTREEPTTDYSTGGLRLED